MAKPPSFFILTENPVYALSRYKMEISIFKVLTFLSESP